MRLEVFSLIDDTLDLLCERESIYHDACEQLQQDMALIILPCADNVATFQSRIKSESSLREKIIRKQMYKKYQTPEEMLGNLSDLIGLRIECRFLREEEIIYRTLRGAFSAPCANGRFRHPEYPHIELDLGEAQPQVQTNGFPIYRIDGVIFHSGMRIRFELQIKALVHTFWGEVEHQIIYKNNTYLLLDGFMNEMLSSIYSSLSMIDHQLSVLYDQVEAQQSENAVLRRENLLSVVAKGISDLFARKMRKSLGFTLNFKHCCDIISRYILFRQDASARPDAPMMLDLFERIAAIAEEEIDFEKPLILENPYAGRDAFGKTLGGYLQSVINADYEWNLFFRIIFALEPNNNIEDFTAFIDMLRGRFLQPRLYAPLYSFWDQRRCASFCDELLAEIARQMVSDGSIRIIYEDAISGICARIEDIILFLSQSDSPDTDWANNKYELTLNLIR